MDAGRFVGTVRWFNKAKGYGFIGKQEDSSPWPEIADNKDVFVHFTAITASGYKKLEENELVEFGVEEGTNGKIQASLVKVLNESKAS